MFKEYIHAICERKNIDKLAKERGFTTEIGQIGFENGFRKGLIETKIWQMKEEGLSIKQISYFTDMSEEEIIEILEEAKAEIAKEMKKQGYSLEKIRSIIKVPMDKLTSWLL